MPLADRHEANLHRRQPKRKRPRIVLNQHTEEPLHRPEQRAMHHDWLMSVAVFAYVLQLKSRRQVEVELHCRELPQTPQHIHQLDIDLRPVERRFAGNRLVRNSLRLQHSSSELIARFQFSSEPV